LSNPDHKSGSADAARTAWRAALQILVIPLVLLILEMVLEKRAVMPAWGWPEWKVFLTGEGWSVLFWINLIFWGAWMAWKSDPRRPLLLSAAALFGVWQFFAYFATYKYLKDMYHLPNVHILQFTIYEWRNAWVLAKDFLHWWHLGAAVLFLAVFSVWFGNRLQAAAPWVASLRPWRRRTALVILSVSFVALSITTLGWHRFQDPLPWDANWNRMFWQYGVMLQGNTTNLQVGNRAKLPKHPGRPRYNVLVILNESLRADAVFPGVRMLNGFSDTLSPKTLRRVSGDSLCFMFPQARSNSGSTNVSVPSLATGLPPEATTYDFHRYQTLWNFGKSMDYKTFVFTSQDWRWEHFDEFFLDKDVDMAVHRRHFAAPLANDLGVDDGLVVDSLLHYLASNRGAPFFGMIQFNITHPPFYGGPGSVKLPPYTPERFRLSARLLDDYTERLFAGLEKLGLYDSTFIIYTSDHGENIRSRNLSRQGCFYDDALRVPFWIKAPRDPEWIRSHADRLGNLRAWTRRPVENLDILPTVLDFLGLPVKSTWGDYAGRSLMGPGADSVRIMSAQNTCEIRSWSPEGCFVMRQPYKLVLANHTPPQLFDLSRDPLEQNNLWSVDSVRRANDPWLIRYMQAMRGREDLCRRLKRNCPEEFLTHM
jgi:hypothetical protein